MANITFELEELAASRQLEITPKKPNVFGKLIFADKGRVDYRQLILGTVTLNNLTIYEKLTLQTSLDLLPQHLKAHPNKHLPLKLQSDEQTAAMQQIDAGRLSLPAFLYRAESIHLGKNGNRLTGLQLAEPAIHSVAGNLASLRGVADEVLFDPTKRPTNRTQVRNLIELAKLSREMESAISDTVTPQLLAVQALTEKTIERSARDHGLDCGPLYAPQTL